MKRKDWRKWMYNLSRRKRLDKDEVMELFLFMLRKHHLNPAYYKFFQRADVEKLIFPHESIEQLRDRYHQERKGWAVFNATR